MIIIYIAVPFRIRTIHSADIQVSGVWQGYLTGGPLTGRRLNGGRGNFGP
jgi:hypothetical protein